MKKLNPSYYETTRAAQVALHCMNYQHASLFCHFSYETVKSSSLEELPGVGNKYHLVFKEDKTSSEDVMRIHTAKILFSHTETRMAPQVNCTYDDTAKANTTDDEHAFYERMRKQEKLVDGKYIPDGHGNIPAEMKPFWLLGQIASSYVMWQESSESTLYNMVTVLSFQQLRTEDDFLDFEYVVLLHDIVSQEITQWSMHIRWNPTHGVKVLNYAQDHRDIPFPGTATATMSPASLS
ncbi:latexin-like [Polypterus senegalus]|uniref:latexin-like n=1 Tax=Polypterus senegalus TaxID=55291 RepID=UPI00196432FD|nr:latexin-like [Polypterus senegalus]XP_039612341.1 latexin-like [Polypterus senegalus]XP_039612351.1 latexin-like [Polypterus senegalus]XP_039612358.1 latexin-like [Polypterus senegalus]XP_039612367.1 latexin-like [Polypterus senegalus]XP_039612376.1 latexin-like [Polypterus senegalus]